MIYLVKIASNIFEYKKLDVPIHLQKINKIIRTEGYPLLNSNDMQFLKGYGGTFVYKTRDFENIWLVDIHHENPTGKGELKDILKDIRLSIKRDLKLKEMLNSN